MKNSRIFVLSLITLVCAVSAQAQTTGEGNKVEATAGELRSVALARQLASLVRNAPEILSAEAAVAAKQAEVSFLKASRWPQLSLSAGAATTQSAPGSRSSAGQGAVSLRYQIDFGAKSSRQDAAQQSVVAAGFSRVEAQEQLAYAALTAYLQAYRNSLLVEVADSSSAILKELEKLEERKVKLGGSGITDARLAAARVAANAAKTAQFRQNLAESRERLAVYFPQGAYFDVLPSLRGVIPPQVKTAADTIQVAFKSSPSLAALQAAISEAESLVEAEKLGRLPRVEVYAQRSFGSSSIPQDTQVGVQLSTATDSFFSAQAQVSKAQSERAERQGKFEQVSRQLRQDAGAAWAAYEGTSARVALLQQSADSARAVFQSRQKLYEAGRDTTLALLDAQLEHNNALIDLVNALADARLQELNVALYSGQLVPVTGQERSWAQAFFNSPDYRAQIKSLMLSK